MKTLVVNKKIIASIFVVLLLTYGVQGTSYGQGEAPTVTPGETNTSLVVRFRITLDEEVDKNAYQIQLRRKTPPEEWTTKCVVIERGSKAFRYRSQGGTGPPDVSVSPKWNSRRWLGTSGSYSDKTFNVGTIFTDLEPGITYEIRYRDTNLPACVETPPSPDLWSGIAEGITHSVTPPRVEFIDANLAIAVRRVLRLSTVGEHIDLLKIPKAALAKLTRLDASKKGIIDLTGLEHASQLRELNLADNNISNIIPLAQLTQLKKLNLEGNPIRDPSPLRKLNLEGNPIGDLSPLAQPPEVETNQSAVLLIGDYQGVDETEAQNAALLVAKELRAQGITVSDPVHEAPASVNVYRVVLQRSDEKILFRLSEEDSVGTLLAEREMLLADVEEIASAASRLVSALVHRKPITLFTTPAQQNSVEAQAKRDAEADVDRLLWTGVGFAAPFGVALAAAVGGLMGHTASPEGGSIVLSGGAACGICVGGTFGGLVLFRAVNNYKLTPPPERLLGKSPEYINVYTDAYKTRTRQLRRQYAGGGYGLTLVVASIVVLIGLQIFEN